MDSTEEYRHECECRDWLARIRARRPGTTKEGADMLKELIADIAKRRGAVAAERLRVGIEAVRAGENKLATPAK